MIAFELVQGLFRVVAFLCLGFKMGWRWLRGVRQGVENRTVELLVSPSAGFETGVEGVRVCETVNGENSPAVTSENPIGRPVSREGRSLVRYGKGFSVACRFFPGSGRVTRVLWLDYARLQREYGACAVRSFRARAGESVSRVQAMPHERGRPVRPWGRIFLEEVTIGYGSLQDAAVLELMDRSVAEAQALIDKTVPPNLIHKRPWRLLPPSPVYADRSGQAQRRQVVAETLAELRTIDQARKKPLASAEDPVETLVRPPLERVTRGLLGMTGHVERVSPSGRRSRSFFAEVDNGIGTVRHGGRDLLRAFLREGINNGERVEVFLLGSRVSPDGRKHAVWSVRRSDS